jgi:hypothetical protein
LATYDIHSTDVPDPNGSSLVIVGTILGTREQIETLSADRALTSFMVSLALQVEGPDDWSCPVPTVDGRARVALPSDRFSQREREDALQSATVDAIDASMLDVLLCLRQWRDRATSEGESEVP